MHPLDYFTLLNLQVFVGERELEGSS